MSDHPDLENDVAAYVLGAAVPEETESIRAHLEGCGSCRELAGRLQRAVDALPLATETIQPPARLKAKIMAAAAASPRSVVAPPTRARVLQLPRVRPNRWSEFASSFRYSSEVAVAALAVAVLGLGAWNVSLLRNQMPVGQPQVLRTTVTGQGQMIGSQAKVIDLRDQGVALVSFSHMPSVGTDKVYELWLINSAGNPEPGGVFRPDVDGSKILVLAKNLKGYRAIAVTIEQGPDGTQAPTQPSTFTGPVA
ncbi:MAG: anti-sigma factor [Candidatus Dormibacteraceae bacterium]